MTGAESGSPPINVQRRGCESLMRLLSVFFALSGAIFNDLLTGELLGRGTGLRLMQRRDLRCWIFLAALHKYAIDRLKLYYIKESEEKLEHYSRCSQ